MTYPAALVQAYPEICELTLMFCFFRVVLCIVLLTSKFYNDIYYQNKYIADEGGVPLEELNLLERHFLDTIDWQLTVKNDQLAVIDKVLTEIFSVQQPSTSSAITTPDSRSLSTSPAGIVPT